VEGFDRAVERAGEYLAAGATRFSKKHCKARTSFRDFAKEIKSTADGEYDEVPARARCFPLSSSPIRLSNGHFFLRAHFGFD